MFFVFMNSKSTPHLSSNSLEAIFNSFFENIAHIRITGRNIIAKNIQNEDIKTPKTSPFKFKSIE